ncbi:alpha-L-rhamnosidase [Paenibacillus phyllosphaerae]|uniref:alpha-L-rhamnosidase n=1 Tax=Paenibacillus phyllosphaerae TaxID=274593 RepID=A0A7W5FND2_9BACL|nr:alpha-L-rhamnosidase [Paenibacillus phyllosphaerae]MBB3111058.1 alpha-L-rhamnosidase [Paenibacillus phyllosphaerae]
MTTRNEERHFGGWAAKWITRPAPDHLEWKNYTVEASVVIESKGTSLLIGVQGSGRYCACHLDSDQQEVTFNLIEHGIHTELERAPAPELALAPAAHAIRLVWSGTEVCLYIGERLVLSADAGAIRAGTIGFRNEEGEAAVIRDLRVYDVQGRALYVNRFYDPSTLQFTAGSIHPSGSGLRLSERELSLCDKPVPADSPRFRTTFRLASEVKHAALRVYALGWYELRLNGRQADDRVLAPANTPYERTMLYDTYDVTGLLNQGGNAIGLWLGNGYNMNYSRWGWKWKRDKAFILQLDLTLTDGTRRQIVSDSSWQTAGSPLLLNDIYDGELYDARLNDPGWDTSSYSAEGWTNATEAESPQGLLEPNMQPPVRPHDRLAPVRSFAFADRTIYDFGQNIAGWVSATVQGAAGSRLTLRYSELVDDEGRIDPWTNRNAHAKDCYVLNGQGIETYEPRFTYHGFRYVEASGTGELLDLKAVPIHADVREAGHFASSDELLNQIQRNIRWSMLNNFVSIPTDCCQRDERTPCLMDSAVVEEAAIHNFDMRLYYRKWLRDIQDSMTNPDWAGDKITLPWHLYWYYGDAEPLREHYESMQAYIDHLKAAWPDGIVKEGFGDWCAPNEDGWEQYFREVEIVNTSLYYQQALTVSKAAGVLGKEDERQRYGVLAEEINRAFHARFYRGEGIYGNGSQTAQLMPLALGMVPEDQTAQAVAGLVQAVAAKGGYLDTGIYGTRYLMDVLADHGQINLAYAMLTRTAYPSFGYQIANGATTLWEQWSFKGGMHSHDHAMFGGIGASFYTRLAGIRPLSPGYEEILIQPSIPDGLQAAEASIDTVRGTIRAAWRKEEGRLVLDITIPEQVKGSLRITAHGSSDMLHDQKLAFGHQVIVVDW